MLSESNSKSDVCEFDEQDIERIPKVETPRPRSRAVESFTSLARAEGFRPTSIEQGKQVLCRFKSFLRTRIEGDLDHASWKEYAAYKAHLAASGLAPSTIRTYLSYLTTFYRLRAQAAQDPALLDVYHKVKAIGSVRRARSVPWRPLDRATVDRLLDAATGEDRVFLLTLLYTGGRAQFYGLRVADMDFPRGEIRAVVKGGKRATIPLHPALAAVLRDHLAARPYASAFLFRHGRDVTTRRGQRANRQNAWRTCKRVQRAAGVEESVHPHRFRKTLATWGKRRGLDPQFLQAILAHESVDITLDAYARVELEDVKRAFAAFDPLEESGVKEEGGEEPENLLTRLRAISPPGKEEAWQSIVDGLAGLIGASPSSVNSSG